MLINNAGFWVSSCGKETGDKGKVLQLSRCLRREKALIGSGGYSSDDVKDVMAIMESGRWDIEKIIAHEYPWEKLPEAIETAGNPEKA